MPQLTVRETEVLKLIAENKRQKEIADELKISIGTIKTHIQNITNKLNIKGIAALTKYALDNSIIS